MNSHGLGNLHSSAVPVMRNSTRHGTSSAFCSEARPDENWTNEPDLATRRRLQNRIAQRNYRKRKRENRSESSEQTSSVAPRARRTSRSRPTGSSTTSQEFPFHTHQRNLSNSSSHDALSPASLPYGTPAYQSYGGHYPPSTNAVHSYDPYGTSSAHYSQAPHYSIESTNIFTQAGPSSPLSALSAPPVSARPSASPNPSYTIMAEPSPASASTADYPYGGSYIPYQTGYGSSFSSGAPYGSSPSFTSGLDPAQVPRQSMSSFYGSPGM